MKNVYFAVTMAILAIFFRAPHSCAQSAHTVIRYYYFSETQLGIQAAIQNASMDGDDRLIEHFIDGRQYTEVSSGKSNFADAQLVAAYTDPAVAEMHIMDKVVSAEQVSLHCQMLKMQEHLWREKHTPK